MSISSSEIETVQEHPRRYLFSFGMTVAGLYLALAFLVAVVDPYGLNDSPTAAGFNKLKYNTSEYERVLKFYQLRYRQPNAIILGSSRAAVGLRPVTLSRYAGRTYNFALNAGTIRENEIAFQFAVRNAPIRVAVLGFHMVSFDKDASEDLPELRRRAANGLWFRLLELARHTLSLAALSDALETVLGNAVGRPASHSPDGMYVNYVGGEIDEAISISRYDPFPAESFEAFERICETAQAHGVALKIFVSPVHVSYSYDPGFRAEWLARLRQIAGRYGFVILDPTTEWNIVNDRSNFLDAGHYKPEIGDRILAALFAEARQTQD